MTVRPGAFVAISVYTLISNKVASVMHDACKQRTRKPETAAIYILFKLDHGLGNRVALSMNQN